MKHAREDEALDLMAYALREQVPPALPARMRSRMVQRAVAEAVVHRERGSSMHWVGWGLAVAAAVAFAFLGRSAGTDSIASDPAPVVFALADGNRAYADPSASVREGESGEIEVGSGDVVVVSHAPLRLVSDVGTIESFRAVYVAGVEPDRLRVLMIAGEVLVQGPTGEVRLGPGDSVDAAGWTLASDLLSLAHEQALELEPETSGPGAAEESPAVSTVEDADALDAPQAEAERPARVSPARVRAWLAAGRYDRALRATDQALRHRPSRQGPGAASWRMLRGDALRGLGRPREAAREYERAAASLPPERAAEAGYLAAWVRTHELGERHRALEDLEASGAAFPGSPVEAPSRVLAANALARDGREAEARREAQRYIERFAGGAADDWMRDLAAGAVVASAP